MYQSDLQYYWPGNSTLGFFAYAPSIDEIRGNTKYPTQLSTSNGVVLQYISPDLDISKQIDLITAATTGSKDLNESTGVELNFKHKLSQIAIQAKNDPDKSNFTYYVKGVKIARIKSMGDFNLTSDEWDVWDDEFADYTINLDQPIELNEYAQDIMDYDVNGSAMLIPQTLGVWDPTTDQTNEKNGAYIAVKICVTTAAGTQVFPTETGKYAWVAVPLAYESNEDAWLPGCKYTYILDFSFGAGLIEPVAGDERGGTSTDPDLAENPGECGENVLGGSIKFTANLTPWDESHDNAYTPVAVSDPTF